MAKVCERCGVTFDRPYSLSIMAKLRFCSVTCSAAARERPASERFDAKCEAQPNGCILWLGAVNDKGYGTFGVGPDHWQRAHIFAFERARGPVPDGKVVMHSCDTPACVNPAHLTIGTQAENLADARAKGRTARGERQGNAKLNDDAVRKIRAWTGTGAAAAKHFGISQSEVSAIRSGKRWSHVQ